MAQNAAAGTLCQAGQLLYGKPGLRRRTALVSARENVTQIRNNPPCSDRRANTCLSKAASVIRLRERCQLRRDGHRGRGWPTKEWRTACLCEWHSVASQRDATRRWPARVVSRTPFHPPQFRCRRAPLMKMAMSYRRIPASLFPWGRHGFPDFNPCIPAPPAD